MHAYRSHTCGQLRAENAGQEIRISGWVHRVRDHGGVLFIDLRDHYGMTQVVADPDSPAFKMAEKVRSEWVIRVDGKVRPRPAGTVNADLPTGPIEVFATEHRGPVAGRRAAAAGVRRHRVPGGHAPELPLPRPAPRPHPPEHHAARPDHRLAPPPHDGPGLLRVPDADPDRVVSPRARATSWCRRASIPASSTRCRRRRSSSSSCS